MVQDKSHVTQMASPTPTSTYADQLLAQLARHKQITNKPTRFFIPSGSVALPEFYKCVVEEKNRIFENDDSVNISIKRIGEWIENPHAPDGLLLAGTPGNGKTTSLKALKLLIALSGYQDPVNYDTYGRPERACLHVVNACDLAKLYTDNEQRFNFLKKTGILAIDDLGLEVTEISKYGNLITPFLDMFYYRYENNLMTILTTNLTISQLNERYGLRFADRLNEMMYRVSFPIISFRHNDYGKKETDYE